MPLRIEQTWRQRHGALDVDTRQRRLRFVHHLLLHAPAFGVDAVEHARHLIGLAGVVGQQARDAERHVLQPSRGVQARGDRKADVRGRESCRVTPRHAHQRLQARTGLACAQATQARADEGAVVGVQRDEIGDRAHRDKIQQGRKVGFGAIESPPLPQHASQREQHVEHHAHARQHLAGERIATQVGIDDRIGRRQHVTGQVMIRHQDLPAACLGRRDAGMTGNPVVHRDQQFGRQCVQFLHQRRRQSVAMDHAIGHRRRDTPCAQQAKPTHADGARGGAVAVEIADDHDMAVGRDGIGEQRRRFIDAAEQVGGKQLGEPGLGLLHRTGPPGFVDALQQHGHMGRPCTGCARLASADPGRRRHAGT